MNQIKPLEPGSGRTLLSASTGNELIDAINGLMTITGEDGSGITVSVADAGVVIGLDPARMKTAVPSGGGGGGSGGWTLYGDWADLAFAQYTVVTYRDATAIANGNVAGAYLSLLAVPSGTPAPGSAPTFWKLLAPYNSTRLVHKTSNKQIDANSNGTGSLPEINLEEVAGGSGAKCMIRLNDLAGRVAYFQEVTVCVDGVSKHMRILATDVY